MSRKESKEKSESNEPPRNKALLYFAFILTAIGAVLTVLPTILIFLPEVELSWSTVFTLPHTYIVIAGLVLVTTGLIIQRKITPPMDKLEEKKLRSRLE
ncbi:MAG: hypothetical protein JXA54_08050 [Candidatus Heimdallarchaeota archaeon]|nr:hypothetical protein [Candidatus Heimdallarchaeota archaeon]